MKASAQKKRNNQQKKASYQMGECICKPYTDKGSVPNIYEEPLQLNSKSNLKMGRGFFPKKTYTWPIGA